MKKNVLIISIICILLLAIFITIYNSKDSIDKTRSIIVTNLKSYDMSKKKITDKDTTLELKVGQQIKVIYDSIEDSNPPILNATIIN